LSRWIKLSFPFNPPVTKLRKEKFSIQMDFFSSYFCVFKAIVDVSGVALSTSSSAKIATRKENIY
jgi:hypothetical protein